MPVKSVEPTQQSIPSVAEQGVNQLLNSCYRELLSLGPDTQKHVYGTFRDYLASCFTLGYLHKANMVVKKKSIHTKTREGREFSRWIDSEVMPQFNQICETDVFDSSTSLSALVEILDTLWSSMSVIDEKSIDEDLGYVLDIPSQFREMVAESSGIPRFYAYSLKRDNSGRAENVTLNMSGKTMRLSFMTDFKR